MILHKQARHFVPSVVTNRQTNELMICDVTSAKKYPIVRSYFLLPITSTFIECPYYILRWDKLDSYATEFVGQRCDVDPQSQQIRDLVWIETSKHILVWDSPEYARLIGYRPIHSSQSSQESKHNAKLTAKQAGGTQGTGGDRNIKGFFDIDLSKAAKKKPILWFV